MAWYNSTGKENHSSIEPISKTYTLKCEKIN
jgi:hypothetical protein